MLFVIMCCESFTW